MFISAVHSVAKMLVFCIHRILNSDVLVSRDTSYNKCSTYNRVRGGIPPREITFSKKVETASFSFSRIPLLSLVVQLSVRRLHFAWTLYTS